MSNNISNLFKTAFIGKRLEDDITAAAVDIYGKDVTVTLGGKCDIEDGTDMILYRVHIDVTADMLHKDFCTELPGEEIALKGQDGIKYAAVKFGVRSGNAYSSFKEKVLVVWIDALDVHELNYQYNRIIGLFTRNMKEILDEGMSRFFDYEDSLEAAL